MRHKALALSLVILCMGQSALATTQVFNLVSGASGHVAGSNASYATLHNQAAANVGNDGLPNIQNELFGGTYLIMRAPLVFDTSSIGSGQTVSAAFLTTKCTGTTRFAEGSSATVVSYSGSGTTLDNNQFDFNLYGTSDGGSLPLSDWTSCATPVDITLNSTGLAFISTTGLTKIALRDSGDISSDVPTGIDSRLNLGDVGEHITLTVTYATSTTPVTPTNDPFGLSTSTASTTAQLIGTVQLGLGIIIVILMVYLCAYLYNSLFRKKQWQR